MSAFQFCIHCGARSYDGVVFCESCGAPREASGDASPSPTRTAMNIKPDFSSRFSRQLICMAALICMMPAAESAFGQERPKIEYKGALPDGWSQPETFTSGKEKKDSYRDQRANRLYKAIFQTYPDTTDRFARSYLAKREIDLQLIWANQHDFESMAGERMAREKFSFGGALASYKDVNGAGLGKYDYFVPIGQGSGKGIWISGSIIAGDPVENLARMKEHINNLTIPRSDLDAVTAANPDGTGGPLVSVIFGEVPWKQVLTNVLAGAAAGLACAGLAGLLGGRIGSSGNKKQAGKENHEGKPDPDRALRYILNPSTDRLALAPGASAPLEVSVWAILASGQKRLATDTAIRLSSRGAEAGNLAIVPDHGNGTVKCRVSAGETSAAASAELIITASGGDGAGGEATVSVELQPGLQLIVQVESIAP